jgi:Flp pilus assembly protein TadB
MAQTKRKRRRRHRGTQAGTIERAGRTTKPPESSPRSKSPAKPAAKQTPAERRQARLDTPPTWRGALNRAAFAAAILVVFVTVTQKNVVQGVILGVFAMLVYVPMSFYTDRALYRRRQKQKQRQGR